MPQTEAPVSDASADLAAVLLDSTEQMLGVVRMDGRILKANRSLASFLNEPPSALVGKPLWSCRCWSIGGPGEDRVHEAVAEAAAGGRATLESGCSDAFGVERRLVLSLAPLADESGHTGHLALSVVLESPRGGVPSSRFARGPHPGRTRSCPDAPPVMEIGCTREQQLIQDIAMHTQASARIVKLSQLYAAISETNNAILRNRTAEGVYRAVCQACVDHIGFRLAWIGVISPDGRQLVPVEAAGPAIAFLRGRTISTQADVPEGRGPAGKAFREQRVFIATNAHPGADLPADAVAAAAAHGIVSAISLPLRRNGIAYGTLNGYGGQEDFFDDEAVRLLEEMADNISFALDLVDRESQEQLTKAALKKSEQRLQAAQAVCSIGDWEVDRRNGQMTWSPQLFALFERDPMRGAPDLNEALGYYDFESVQRTRDYFWMAIDTGERCALEQTLHLPSGRIAHHGTLIVPVKDAEGYVIKLYGTVQDITERKLAEQELHRKTAETEDLYQNAPCGYHSLDSAGRILRINDTELRWLGYTREEVVGNLSAFDILTPASHDIFSQKFPWLKSVGVVRNLEVELRRRDGTALPALMSSTGIFDEEGNFVATRCVVVDNSNRKQLEIERMDHAARLAGLSRHLVELQENERRLLAAELHDRASPNLAALKITLSNLARTLPPAMLEQSEPLLDDMQGLLLDTTTGIREICADLRPATLDYAGLIPAIRDYAEQFSRRNAIRVVVDHEGFDAPLLPDVQSLLFRIAQEALTNCAKHASASAVTIRFSAMDGGVTMAIADDGVGFDPAALARDGSSPGLGLINMRERARFAGGRLAIRSMHGSGTEIRVTFEGPTASDRRGSAHFLF